MTPTSPTLARVGPARPVDWLVCFAVKEEAVYFSTLANSLAARVVVTGMGSQNATQAIQAALKEWRPRSVITAGFAGGLNPVLHRGTVVHDPDDELRIAEELKRLGAVPGTFHCARRIAVTTADKAGLWQQTGADAVEMESSIIRAACREAGVPSATVRVISDAAGDDLPLDFNALMTADVRINWWQFARTIAGRPSLIGRLMEFQRQTRNAARALGRVLQAVVQRPPVRSQL